MQEFFQRLEIFARREPFRMDLVEVLLIERRRDANGESISRGVPITMEPIKEYEIAQPPTFELRPQEAQQLMDELWRCGLRPTEGSGSAGQLAAVQAHLQDMRKLALGDKAG